MAEPVPATLALFKLVVPDLDAAEKFYIGALGMQRRLTFEAPGFREVVLGHGRQDVSLVLLQWTDGRALPAGGLHGPVGFFTPDLDQLIRQLEAAGARVKMPPMEDAGMRIAFMESPDGHELELLQLLAPEG